MSIGVLTNPLGAGYYDGAPSIGNYQQSVKIDPNSAALPIGTVVELEAYAGPGTTNPPTVPVVQASSITADSLVLGVLAGGTVTSAAKTVAPATAGSVCVLGLIQVLCDATTTAGFPLIQSAVTAGAAKCTTAGAAPAAGQGLGVALQAVTITTGTALVWAYIRIV